MVDDIFRFSQASRQDETLLLSVKQAVQAVRVANLDFLQVCACKHSINLDVDVVDYWVEELLHVLPSKLLACSADVCSAGNV